MDGFFYGILFGGLWSHRHEMPEEKQARQEKQAQETAARNHHRAHMVGGPAWRRARGLTYWQWCCHSIRHPLSSRKLPEVPQ